MKTSSKYLITHFLFLYKKRNVKAKKVQRQFES